MIQKANKVTRVKAPNHQGWTLCRRCCDSFLYADLWNIATTENGVTKSGRLLYCSACSAVKVDRMNRALSIVNEASAAFDREKSVSKVEKED